ncbi:MAG: hypothetical protein NTV84_00825, partial [Methanoregula sp.]|nr:hypothetical protein [Methanoregula sp.]
TSAMMKARPSFFVVQLVMDDQYSGDAICYGLWLYPGVDERPAIISIENSTSDTSLERSWGIIPQIKTSR